MKKSDIEDIEINLLLEAIYQRYGHDFRPYVDWHFLKLHLHFSGIFSKKVSTTFGVR